SGREWVDRWGDWILAFALAAGAEYELWARSAGLDSAGGRAPLAVLVAVATVPLAWRRQAPVVVVFVVAGTIAVAGFLISHPNGLPVELFLAPILAFYSLGANCEERRALLAGGGALASIAA